ncbi:UNKNOWN [Stylonychia lemnae]|uniref:Uncharacterized protein n=1 Tax=Stylonychia lemnae TaxID=5949 RepID=A0A078B2T3_STYLE|nr:UNKNOWN [Stylonychia lemnae]|eukprot:CDW87818.1 UNKNOWN [Stylonychia lemnae]
MDKINNESPVQLRQQNTNKGQETKNVSPRLELIENNKISNVLSPQNQSRRESLIKDVKAETKTTDKKQYINQNVTIGLEQVKRVNPIAGPASTSDNQQTNRSSLKASQGDEKYSKLKQFQMAGQLQSFDIIWFDLVTKSRSLIQEITEPLIERQHDMRDKLQQTNRIIDDQDRRIKDMEYIVLQKGNRIDVFEQFQQKIEQVDQRGKEMNIALDLKITKSDQKMEEISFKLANYEKIMKSLLDRVLFEVEKVVVWDKLESHTTRLFEAENNNHTLHNYVDKYQQIRFQNQLTDTLMGVLSQKERRRLENYDSDKMPLLYKIALEDNGQITNIQKMIIQLNEKAKRETEEEEKKKKRRNIASEASKSQSDVNSTVGGGEFQFNKKGHSIGGQSKRGTSQFRNTIHTEEGFEIKSEESEVDEGRQSVAEMDDGISRKRSVINKTPRTALHKGSQWGQQSKATDDNYNYNLVDLIQSDFSIQEDDDDFDLTNEQLIKIMKIFLYKMNLTSKKIEFVKQDFNKTIENAQQQNQFYTKSTFEEISQFIHTLHSDFESFLKKHKKEHSEIVQKVNSIDQKANQADLSSQDIRQSVESYSTMLSCLVEFCNIEQALALQDEQDRQKIQLIGSKSTLKGEKPSNDYNQLQQQFQGFGGINFNASLNQGMSIGGTTTNIHNNFGIKSTYRSRMSNIKIKNASNVQNDEFLQSLSVREESQPDLNDITMQGQTNKNVIEIDKNCLACQGQSSHIIQQFKMACLSYTPSLVVYRNEKFSRQSLMQMRNILMQKCEEVINENYLLFKDRGLQTQKVFKDLVQYFQGKNITDGQFIAHDGKKNREKLNKSMIINMKAGQNEASRNFSQSRNIPGTVNSSGLHSQLGQNAPSLYQTQKTADPESNIRLFKLRQNNNQHYETMIPQNTSKSSKSQQRRQSNKSNINNLNNNQGDNPLDEVKTIGKNDDKNLTFHNRFASLQVTNHELNLPSINLI